MINSRDLICKCNSIKIDTIVKKNNRAKTKSGNKSGTNEKNTTKDGQRLVRLTQI